MLNRREFIGVACSVALASRATALPSDRFKWAMSSHMFTPMKPHPEDGVKMAARFGFHGIEPWGNELESYLKQPPLSSSRCSTQPASASHRSPAEATTSTRRSCKRRSPATPRTRNSARISGSRRSRRTSAGASGQEDLSTSNARILARNLNEVGKRTLEHGVKFAFHPHAWTMAERQARGRDDPRDDRSQAGVCHPRYVPCVGGRLRSGDVRTRRTIRESRISISRTRCRSGAPERMARSGTEQGRGSRDGEETRAATDSDAIYQRLGTGGVDFPALIQVLRDRRYDGWISLDFNYVDMPPGVTIERTWPRTGA